MLQDLKELIGIDPEDFNWQDIALCRGTDTNLYYDHYESDSQIAKMVDAECLSCPVFAQCLQYGTDHDEQGVWGGIYLFNGKPDDTRNAHKTPEVWKEIEERISGNLIH